MAISRIRLDAPHKDAPGSGAGAGADESARWEAYCALQARKRRNELQAPGDRGAAFNPPQPFPSDTWGGDFARRARPPAHDEPPVSSTPQAFAAETPLPRPRGARGWRTALPTALILAAGGIVVAGALLSHPPSVAHAKARDTRPHPSVDLSAPPSVPVAQSSAAGGGSGRLSGHIPAGRGDPRANTRASPERKAVSSATRWRRAGRCESSYREDVRIRILNGGRVGKALTQGWTCNTKSRSAASSRSSGP